MEKIIFCLKILFLGFISTTSAQQNTASYEDLSSQIITSAKESGIICIGEHSHRDLNAIGTKALILKDVADHVPTGAILFEAPLVTSVIAHIKNKSYSEFVWPFWRYHSIKITLDSIIDSHQLICLGFDPQETCNFSRFSTFLISEGFLENDVELSKMDSILSFTINDGSISKTRKLTNDEAEKLNEIIEKIKLNLHWPVGISKTEKALISLCFDNRKHLAKEMTFHNLNDQMNFRDSIMALNIKEILEIIKPDLEEKKVIVWAANLHIAKKINRGDWMMERFIKNNNDRVLSIGVIRHSLKLKSKKFDFAVISGRPDYMSQEMYFDYGCD